MRVPQDRTIPYGIAVIVCAVIVWLVIVMLPARVLGIA
jgi:hypothetical protein